MSMDMFNTETSLVELNCVYEQGTKQNREASRFDPQGYLIWQAQYDFQNNKIVISHFRTGELLRKEIYDFQNNLTDIHYYASNGQLVKQDIRLILD